MHANAAINGTRFCDDFAVFLKNDVKQSVCSNLLYADSTKIYFWW